MPSVVSDFEYDIFISYRHNDNRSGWVTEFVKALQEELAATIKEPISVYFDTNPYDGLLETHNVDRSLEGKLKCLIFIPIISQTYCDPKSFAWQHEFVAFNKLAKEDLFGRDVKLNNGNVASRILPIKIHDLDPDDKLVIEFEIGGVLRAIDFIYKEPGVNRPLKSHDTKSDNQNKTDYRNQVNKVANAVKDIIHTLSKPTHQVTRVAIPPLSTQKRKPLFVAVLLFLFLSIVGYWLYQKLFFQSGNEVTLDKSIAVLPFVDMSAGKDQEYLGDGVADEIINALSQVSELKVIGRTSSFQFKGEKVDLREVGNKLRVATVLEGSVMKDGNKLRITAKLINVKDGSQIWAERYNREIQDVFLIQDEIATKIAQKLANSLLKKSIDPISIPTTNMAAYEMTMKGNFFLRQGPSGSEKAKEYFLKAVQLDSNYSEAQLGYTYTFIFGGSSDEMLDAVDKLKLLRVNARILNSLMATYYLWRKGDWIRTRQLYDSAKAAGYPPDITYAYYEAAVEKNMKEAVNTLEKVVELDPLFLDGLRNLGWFYIYAGEFDKAHDIIDKMMEINSGYIDTYYLGTELSLREKKFSQALAECSLAAERFEDQKKFLSIKIKALAGEGQLSDAKKLFYDFKVEEDPDFRWLLADCYFSLGMEDKGFKWIRDESARNPAIVINILIDPFFDPYRNDHRFKEAIAKWNLPEPIN